MKADPSKYVKLAVGTGTMFAMGFGGAIDAGMHALGGVTGIIGKGVTKGRAALMGLVGAMFLPAEPVPQAVDGSPPELGGRLSRT